jgi:hypothetical protein
MAGAALFVFNDAWHQSSAPAHGSPARALNVSPPFDGY